MSDLTDYNALMEHWLWTESYVRIGPRPVTQTPVENGTIFASPTGTGVGTELDPASLAAANAAAGPGDVVFLRGGTYTMPPANFHFAAGAAGNKVTFESYPGEFAVIDGSAQAPVNYANGPHCEVGGYTILRRLCVRGNPGQGFLVMTNYNEFHGLWFDSNRLSGFQIYSGHYNQVFDCVATDNSDAGLHKSNYPNGGYEDGNNADGMGTSSGDYNEFKYCWADRNSDDGLDTWIGVSTLLEYCIGSNSGIAAGDGRDITLGYPDPPASAIARHCLAYGGRTNFKHNSANDASNYNCTAYNSVYNTAFGGLNPNSHVEDCIATVAVMAGGTQIGNSWNRGGNVTFVSTDPDEVGFMVPTPGGGFEDIGVFAGSTGGPPVITPIQKQVTLDTDLPGYYPAGDHCSSNAGPLTNFRLDPLVPGFDNNVSDGGISALVGAAVDTHSITLKVDNDAGTSSETFEWEITTAAQGISLSDPMSQVNGPSNIVIGCTSNSTDGVIYAGVSTTEYTDKTVLADPNNSKHVWQGSKPAEIMPRFTINTLEPEVPYHTGFYQSDDPITGSDLISFAVDVGAFTFTRTGPQTGFSYSDDLVEITEDNASVHPGAIWDGSVYTSPGGESKGGLLEPGTTRINDYAHSLANFAGGGSTVGPTITRGDLSLTKLEEDNSVGKHERVLTVITTDNTDYCISGIFKKDERTKIDLFFGAKNDTWGHLLADIDTKAVHYDDTDDYGFIDLTTELVLVWIRYNSKTGGSDTKLGVAGSDPGGAASNSYQGVTGYGYYVGGLQIEEGMFPTSALLGEGATQTRGATSLTGTMAALGYTAALNDMSGQLPIYANFDYDSGIGLESLLTIGTGNDKIELAINGGSINLIKTYGGATATATVSGLAYQFGDRLNIRWMVHSTDGLKLWVNDVTPATDPDANPLQVLPSDIEIHPARIICEHFRYKNTAVEAEVVAWA